MDLQALLLTLDGLDLAQIESLARTEYRTQILNSGKIGIHRAHDGSEVVFHEDRFEHAFFTSPNRARNPYEKTKLDQERVRRIRWIRGTIAGNAPGSECWEVPGAGMRRRPPDRIYVIWPEGYVIWLFPRDQGGWKFSSAYAPGAKEIRRYLHGGRRIWVWKEG